MSDTIGDKVNKLLATYEDKLNDPQPEDIKNFTNELSKIIIHEIVTEAIKATIDEFFVKNYLGISNAFPNAGQIFIVKGTGGLIKKDNNNV